MTSRYSHVIGFDDAPFARDHRGDVLVVGAVFAGARLEGVLSAKVRRDGANATRVLAELIRRSKFRAHVQAVLLQGIAFAGFNVVDIHALHAALGIPVVVVARRRPNLAAIRAALLDKVRGGRRKWARVERAGPMQPCAGLFVQGAGISLGDTERLIRRLALNGALPEPLRTAHLIAGGVTAGESRHRP
jgi:hypothetical protein